MNAQQRIIILHLSLITDIGPGIVQKIVQSQHSLQDLYSASASALMRLYSITQQSAEKIVAGLADIKRLETECKLIEQHAISWMTLLDDDYPYLLKQIHLPPPVLYWQGSPLSDTQKHIAVVGSRKADFYGQQIVDSIVPALIAQNWVIVSGGALGADSMAHQAAVNANSKTIVVLGSGLLKPYPAKNKQLFKDVVAAGGTILSPFPLMMDSLPYNFPARNRIIAGLSRGCVVVQAAKESGASITAHLALNQGRDVFAVPGPIDNELSAGCHELIQQGAKLVTCANDILQEYGEAVLTSVPVVSAKKVKPDASQLSVFVDDGTLRSKILYACGQACSVDELLAVVDLSLAELQAELFELQLEGAVTQNFAGKWQSVRR